MNDSSAAIGPDDHDVEALRQKLVEATRLFVEIVQEGVMHLSQCGGDGDDLRRLLELAPSAEAHESGTSVALKKNFLEHVVSAIEDSKRVASALERRAVCIDHVAIAVRDLESATASLACYGFEVIERRTVQGEFSGMVSATLRAGGVTLVLCQGDSPRSNVTQYIEAYGPGVQHLAIRVNGLEQLVVDVSDRGAKLLTGVIRAPGLNQIFTRRDHSTGMQFEFLERRANDAFDDANVLELFSAMEREGVF